MKKLLFFFALLFMGAMTVFAQVPTNQQLTYQTVVRNAQNQLVFSQNNVSVLVEVCKADGSVVWYSENHTGLSTNANGLLTLMVGSSTSHTGNWADIDWSDAAIRTTVSYDPGTGTVTIPSGLAPISAVPYALQAGNASNITNLIGDAIHDSIVNNISSQIHDTVTNYLTNNNYVTETVMGSAIHDSITNNVTSTISSQIHDSIADINSDLTALTDRVNTFNTHVCDSVQDCIKNYLTDNHYVTETVMGNAIHDSITNNVTNTISEQIHDSIVSISGDLTDLENRVNTFNTHVCDSVKDCVTGWIHDSIASNIADNVSSQIHDSIVYNINNNISDQIHDSVSNYLTNNHYVTESNLCTAIGTNCTNVAMRDENNTFTGNNTFSGSVTVPNAVTPDLATALASTCTQEAVNLCDLIAVFDSLNRRINSVYDSLQRLNDELTALKNTIPPMTNAPTVSNVTSSSMNVKANATSDGAAITSYEFCISTNSDMSGATCQTVQASDADNYTFTGLTPNTNYYVRYSATNFAGTTPSATVQQRTPAHAPTATVSDPTAAKPAGFKVTVTGIDPKEKDDAITVQVCYTPNTGTCPEKESANYTECKMVNATGVADTTISVTGLTPSTEYCAIVKVSNGDSTSLYGPYTVTTGADVTMTITQTGGGTISLCGASSVPVTYTATPSDGTAGYTYSWSGSPASTSDNTATYSYTATGNYSVTVTATHTTEGYTLTATASTTVNSGGTAVSIGFCESEGVVSVKSVSGSPNSISWGDGQTGTIITPSTTHDYNSTLTGNGQHNVTITASSADGCTFSRTMTVTIASTAADRTVNPCTVDPASHAAQTGGAYTNNGYNSANHGLETVNGSGQVTSVTDYDGNAYPVVQIGSQCWMAENLRCEHSPKTGSNIVVTAVSNYGSKMAAWYNNARSTYEPKRYGLLYNWCAAMDTAKPSDGSYTYVEVATADNTSNYFNFTPSGNHQGVCPMGWHVPSDAEWNAMELEVNGSDVSGSTGYRGSHAGKLSTGCDWSSSSTENAAGNYANAERNDSGFSAVPAGNFSGSFYNAGNVANFWSSSQNSSHNAWYRYLYYDNAGVYRGSNYKGYGFSVRCVRD